MGILKHVTTGRRVNLPAHAVVGRAPNSAVRLSDQAASNDHAAVFWTGKSWEARDLGSTNGTFVNKERLRAKENVQLRRGEVLRFGCDGERWELVDSGAPVLLARSVATGETRAEEDGLLALPEPDRPIVSILADSSGQWLIEGEDGSRRPAKDGERLLFDGKAWELIVPPESPVGGTYKAQSSLRLASLTLRFHVSRDEQHVQVEAMDDDVTVSLGEKAYFSLLLLLARKRHEDAADASLPEDERGWIHMIDLLDRLHKEETSLNVDVLRLREAFTRAEIEGANGIVERRRRQIRIGTGRVKIDKA